MKSILKIILFVPLMLVGCIISDPPPASYSIFNGTPVKKLAKAVMKNDTVKIRELILSDSLDVNFQEPLYGFTVLMTALTNSRSYFWKIKPETIETLLKLGADPNIYGDKYGQSGFNPVIVACRDNYYDGLRLLLEYGGDPNSQARCKWGHWPTDETALMSVVGSLEDRDDIRCIELLLAYGVDPNVKTKRIKGGALQFAVFVNPKALLCLLEGGADPNTLIYDCSLEEGTPLVQVLRWRIYPLDSEEYKYKMKVTEYLKSKGIDYRACPIPEEVLQYIKNEYPDSWEDYIEKY